MKKYVALIVITIILFATCVHAVDWKSLAEDIIIEYQGKIVSIEQLNSSTCWAMLSPRMLNNQAVKVAENIGYYVKNVTGETPSVHVFVNGKHIVIARPSGRKYIGQIKIENWNPSAFSGQYRP